MKKSLNQVKTSYAQVINSASETQNSMTKHKENYLKMIKDVNDRNYKYKVIVVKEFENLKSRLVTK
jgi:hypothetical protein